MSCPANHLGTVDLASDLYSLIGPASESLASIGPGSRPDSPILGLGEELKEDLAETPLGKIDTILKGEFGSASRFHSVAKQTNYPFTRSSSMSTLNVSQSAQKTRRLDASSNGTPSSTPFAPRLPSPDLDWSEDDDDASLFYNHIPSRLPSRRRSRRNGQKQNTLEFHSMRMNPTQTTSPRAPQPRSSSVHSHSSSGESSGPCSRTRRTFESGSTCTSSSHASTPSAVLLTPTSQRSLDGNTNINDSGHCQFPAPSYTYLGNATTSSKHPSTNFDRQDTRSAIQPVQGSRHASSRENVDPGDKSLGGPQFQNSSRVEHPYAQARISSAPTKQFKKSSHGSLMEQTWVDGKIPAIPRKASRSYYNTLPRPSTAPTPTSVADRNLAYQISHTDDYLGRTPVVRDEKRKLREKASHASLAQANAPTRGLHSFKLFALKSLFFR